MRRWDPLNSRQFELLKRVGAGADLSDAADVPHRTSAYALSNRGLVTVSKRGGVFRALITDAGRYYLEHGHHPDRPDPVPRTRRGSSQEPEATAATNTTAVAPTALKSAAPTPDRAATAKTAEIKKQTAATSAGRDLVDLVTASGGVLRIAKPEPGTRSAHVKAATQANRTGLVPAGHNLRHSTRSNGEFVIVLVDDAHPDTMSWNPPRRGRAPGAFGIVAATMRDHPTAFDVSDAVRPRALALLQALVDEAQTRGHHLTVPRRRKHPLPLLNVNHYACELHLVEEKDRVPRTPTTRPRRRSYSWDPASAFDEVPSGRLRLEARQMYYGVAAHQWSDTNRAPLEKQLRQIFGDLEAEAEARHRKQLAWQKKEEERQERERREQAVRQAQWEEAMRKARKAAVATYRRRIFAAALDDWNTALEIRALCEALEEAATRTPEHHHAERLRQWIAWGRNQADRLDPTTPVGLEHTPFHHEPGPDDLRPHLGEWSPFRAEREHRYEPRGRESNQPTPPENWFTRRARQWWRR